MVAVLDFPATADTGVAVSQVRDGQKPGAVGAQADGRAVAGEGGQSGAGVQREAVCNQAMGADCRGVRV